MSRSKYEAWYLALMDRARGRQLLETCEQHHSLPKCLGGTDEHLVALTFREHFVAHVLLTKFTTGDALRKMHFALSCMRRKSKHHDRLLTSRQYDQCRRALSAAMTGRTVSEETRERMRAAALKRGDEYGRRMSIVQSGKPKRPETKEKISEAMRNMAPEKRERMDAPRRGKSWGHHSEATREKIRVAALARYAR